MLRFISRHIFTGLITILPVIFTLYLFYWFIVSTESFLGDMIRLLLPNAQYWPGMGFLAGLSLVFFIGLLMHVYVVQRLFSKAEQLLYHTPLIKTIYRAFRDFFHFFSASKNNDFEQVVAVKLDNGMQLVGFITQQHSEQLPQGLNIEGSVLVYLPLSYMIGGYTILVPQRNITPLDMSMEEAMRFTLTAGIAGDNVK
jgi:uncharacterized membrane protein